jgi:NAD(P)-dependent dehydrogenase (short-subunit alcohol dehydrogenase family)
MAGRTEEKLEKVADVYGKDIPGKIIPISADVSKKDDIKNFVSEIESERCLCILINNEGISSNN